MHQHQLTCNLIIVGLLSLSLVSCKHSKNDANSNEIIPIDTNLIKSSSIEFTKGIQDSTGVFLCYEEMPVFPGGEKALIKFIKSNTIYPPSAIRDSLEGRVILKFVIKTNGSVDNVMVIRGIRYDLDNECIRVTKMLPRFKPGKAMGKTVPVWYVIPFRFILKRNEDTDGIIIFPQEQQRTSTIKVKLYPNPAKDFLTVELAELPDNAEYNIVSVNGQLLKNGMLQDYTQRLEIIDLEEGLYVFTLKANGSVLYSQKIVVKK